MEVDVGGKIFRLTANQLNNLPTSRLSIMFNNEFKLCPENTSKVVYFDRDPESFSCILSAYKGCQIHAPKSVCPIQLQTEMMFWFIDESLLDICCNERLEASLNIIQKNEKNMAEKMQHHTLKQQKIQLLTKVKSWEDFCNNWNTIRIRLWSIAEDPSSSVLAKIWMLASITFILISLIVFVLGTVEGYYITSESGVEEEIPILSEIETVCMAWFTFEYSIRLIVSPCKWKFLRQFLNIIDLLSIIPFFIEIFSHSSESFSNIDTWIHMTQYSGHVSVIFVLLRILRIVRVFRLGRHSEGLKLLCITLYHSANELVMLSIYLFIGIIMLATTLYAIEGDLFANLCDALWFSAVTITTVGYGDIAPKTIAGKIVASMSFLLGLIAIAIPIHPIITNFSNCYRTNKDIELAFKRSLKIMKLEGFLHNQNKNEPVDTPRKVSTSKMNSDKKMQKPSFASNHIRLSKTSVTKLASSIVSVTELLPTRDTCSHQQCHCVFCSE